VGGQQDLGDFMVMERSTEDTITIYGSNGNLGPEPGSKSFSLAACIAANGGLPVLPDANPPADNNPPADDDEAETRRREAEEAIDFCYEAYDFFGGDSDLLADCLNFALTDYRDVLTGEEVLNLIVMVFCLNVIVGNGILPIGVVLFLAWHRRWLRRIPNPFKLN
jgi:hypothetical protein